jgi:hypothetical protein
VKLAFDHRRCPVCSSIMRLVLLEPRRPTGQDGYERHVYRCTECENVSRFILRYIRCTELEADPCLRQLNLC